MDWEFLDKILAAFGFNDKTRNIISQLVFIPSFVVMINGSPFDFFKSSKGLGKVDLLSPILFIIGAIRFRKTKKFMPAGLIQALGALSVVVTTLALDKG